VISKDAYSGMATLVARSDDPSRTTPAIRAALNRIDRHVMIDKLEPVEGLYAETLTQQRMLLVLMVAFSVAGLAVAAVGVYGVLSGIVAQQLREIGVRIMLGADPATMARIVFHSGLTLAGIGAAIGVVIAALSGRLISSVLFDVRATDVASYAIVVLVLAVSVVLAAWRPARRAARADPASLLRDS